MGSESRHSIRDATSADTEPMVAIAVSAWRPVFESYRNIMGAKLFAMVHSDWKDNKASQIRTAAAGDSPVSFIVEEREGRVVGFASWIERPDRNGRRIAEIGNNAVDPAWQNRGIAAALYGEILRRCRASGLDAVKVTTGLDPSHAPARRAYEKVGFGSGIPSVTYWQDLTE